MKFVVGSGMLSRLVPRVVLLGALAVAVPIHGGSLLLAQDATKESKAGDDAAKPEAEKALPAGHSNHGEAFNEGPRQKAYLMGNTGNVTFPATCAKPLVQKFINQGVGQLLSLIHI